MSKWDSRFMALAEFVAGWSKDPTKKVGAVIVDTDNRLVSVGYNGFPAGIEDTSARLNDAELKNAFMLHAEDNALEQATKLQPYEGCTLYVWPAFPCVDCAKRVVRCNFIDRVVAPAIRVTSGWKTSQELALALFKEAYIDVQLWPAD